MIKNEEEYEEFSPIESKLVKYSLLLGTSLLVILYFVAEHIFPR